MIVSYSFVFIGWQFPSLISKFISFSLFLWWLWDDQYLCHYFLTEAFIIHPSCLCEQLLLLCCHWSFSSLFYLYLANTFCNLSHYLLIPFSSEGLSPDITFPRSSSTLVLLNCPPELRCFIHIKIYNLIWLQQWSLRRLALLLAVGWKLLTIYWQKITNLSSPVIPHF